jgi:PEGA domain
MIPTRHLRHAALALALGASAVASSAPARAAAPVEAEAAGEQAGKLFRQGNAAFEQKKWAEAEAAYLQAWNLARTFDVAANLGEVNLQLGRPREAARYLAFSVRSAPPSAKAPQRERTKHFLEEARKQVGAILVLVNLPDAHVAIDGHPVESGDLPFELFVDPAAHTIVAQRDGYVDARATIQVSAGSTQEVPLVLRRSVVPGAVLGGVAGAALVTSAVLLGVGASKRSSAQSLNASIVSERHTCVAGASNLDARCPQLNDTALSAGTFHDTGVGVLAGAGAVAVGTAAYFLWRASTPSRAVRVAPTVSPTSAGVLFVGSF